MCNPETCAVVFDSEDELGESAESFNRPIKTLSEVLHEQSDRQSFSEMLTSHLELEVLASEMLRHMVKAVQASGGAILTEHGGELTVTATQAMKKGHAIAENKLIHRAAKMSERQLIRFPADIVPYGVIDEFQPRELIIEPILYKQVLPGIIALGGSYAQADFDRVSAMEVQAAQLCWQVPQMLTLEEIEEILGIAGGDLAYADTFPGF